MMKRILLLLAAALMLTSANAQFLRPPSTLVSANNAIQTVRPEAKKEVAQMHTSCFPVMQAPKKADNFFMWYRRPAGAFPASLVVENGTNAGMIYAPYITVKPYTWYTFNAFATGLGENAVCEWDVEHWIVNEDGVEEKVWQTFPGTGESGMDLTMKWGIEVAEVPRLLLDDGEDFYSWALSGYEMGGTSYKPVIVAEDPSYILSMPNTMHFWGYDILKSSKNFCYGGRNGDKFYPMTYYSGAESYGDNEDGYWFGKNGGAGDCYRIDGIAQAFEKPTAPYLLNQVVMDCAFLEVAVDAQVEMTCKIYKLDKIPAYNDTVSVTLPDEPGELIARGRAIVTPETEATTGGLVFFNLYEEEDGLEFDITPTIDCAILVAIDGYNEPEMRNLINFSAMISSDWDVDEGFGELAYLKFGIPDEDGNLDRYVWTGLDNFFSGPMAMKTGLTIFLSTELPYLSFLYDDEGENGEYNFPREGGVMEKTFGDHTCRSIEFRSWESSADDAWHVTCDGGDVPDWLTIDLEDQMEQDEFNGIVNAVVTAKPLPIVVAYREAVIRFEYPGAYIDYKFKQGSKVGPIVPEDGDVNRDGCVNITDVNLVIEMIIAGTYIDTGDLDWDLRVTIADLNRLIAIILELE